MAKNILTATVAPVQIGTIEIEGLRTDCGLFAVTMQQTANVFQVSPTSVQRSVKRALGKDYRFSRVLIKNSKSRKPENCLLLPDFSRYHRHLDKKGNSIAVVLGDALNEVGFTQFFADAFDISLSKEDRQKVASRVMSNHCPWEKLYERDMCLKIQKWYGFNCTKFYWWYCYSWLTPEEKCKLEEVNPVLTLVSKNGKQRTSRKRKIHQHLDKVTRTRLTKLVQDLYSCIRFSRSRIDFERSWNAEYGAPEQLEIFDLWDFAS